MFESYLFYCLAAYFNDIAVGAVCCRVDHSQNQKRLYIMTLGCLAPYRRLGIGKELHMSDAAVHLLTLCFVLLALPLSSEFLRCLVNLPDVG